MLPVIISLTSAQVRIHSAESTDFYLCAHRYTHTHTDTTHTHAAGDHLTHFMFDLPSPSPVSHTQVRIHRAESTDFYLRVRSRPIIEHTTGARFAPYAFTDPGVLVRMGVCVCVCVCACVCVRVCVCAAGPSLSTPQGGVPLHFTHSSNLSSWCACVCVCVCARAAFGLSYFPIHAQPHTHRRHKTLYLSYTHACTHNHTHGRS